MRKSHRFSTWVIGVVVAACAFPVQADVTSISVQKGGFFFQTAPNGPPTIDRFDYLIAIGTQGPGEVGAASVSFGGLAAPIALSKFAGPPPIWAAGASFGTQAALDAAVPFTTATFEISGGTLGTASADLDLSIDLYPNNIPQFDAATFNGLQAVDPSVDFTVAFNGFTPSAALAVTGILFASSTHGGAILAPKPTSTEIIIPAGTLLPNTQYSLALAYQQFIFGAVVEPGPFQGALTVYEGAHLTSTPMQTVPEPGTLSLLAVGLAAALRRRAVTAPMRSNSTAS